MKVKVFAAALLALALMCPAVSAIDTYKECLDCFYTNRTAYYYCQSNRRCLPMKSTSCPASQMITKEFQCVNGFQDCNNVTFTMQSIGQNVQFGYGLQPGNGCYIQMDRIRNGAVGTMQISFEDRSSLLVFDNLERNYQSGKILTMPVIDSGWASRKVFIVNKGDQPAGFTVEFIGAHFFKSTSFLALIAFIYTLTYAIM